MDQYILNSSAFNFRMTGDFPTSTANARASACKSLCPRKVVPFNSRVCSVAVLGTLKVVGVAPATEQTRELKGATFLGQRALQALARAFAVDVGKSPVI